MNKIKKNKLNRVEYRRNELNYYINSALNKNYLLDPVSLKRLKFNLNDTSEKVFSGEVCKISIAKIRNICVITGRARAVVLDYKMSRIKFKQNAEAGWIPGIKKL
jgi:ribosomal protein S14